MHHRRGGAALGQGANGAVADAERAAPASPMLLRVGLAGLGFNLLHGLDVQLTVISPGLARWLGMVLRHLPGMWPWIQAMPVWVRWLWVVGAWSAVLGSVLMLLRSRRATEAFVLAFAAHVAVYTAQFEDAGGSEPSRWLAGSLMLMLLMAQWWYTRDQFWNGSLR